MYKIINLKHTQGEMNGYSYDNHAFTCLSDNSSKALVCGTNVEVLKCKTETFKSIVSSRSLNPESFPGNFLEPVFDQYGKMTDFKVVSE